MQQIKCPSIFRFSVIVFSACFLTACTQPEPEPEHENTDIDLTQAPLISHMYTADPSAHVFDGKVYIYPSHDQDHDNASTREGDHYDMEDYHVFSLENMHTPPMDHGQVLHVDRVPWAEKQMWAPDTAFKNGRYYLYFPAKDYEGIFRIGVAISEEPAGPFTAQTEPIPGPFSIDPAVYIDDDGQAYLYFGGQSAGAVYVPGADPGTGHRMDDASFHRPV